MLSWQYDWRGAALLNTRILVCRRCNDTPQEQLRAIVVPADPVPVINARVEPFLYDEFTAGPSQPIGVPTGLSAQPPPQAQFGTTHYGQAIPVLSVTANGTTLIAATCSAPHGLSTNSQISVAGLANNLADGSYSVVVTSATAFTWTVFNNVPAGALLTPTTNIVTALIGLPLGYTTIPVVA